MSAPYDLLTELVDETFDIIKGDSKGDSKSSDSKEDKGQREQKESKLFNGSSYFDFDWDSRTLQSNNVLGKEAKDISLEVKSSHKAESTASYPTDLSFPKRNCNSFYPINSQISLDEAIRQKVHEVEVRDRGGRIVEKFFSRVMELIGLTHIAIRTRVFDSTFQAPLTNLLKKNKLRCLVIEVEDIQGIKELLNDLHFYSELEELEVHIDQKSPLFETDLVWSQELSQIRQQCQSILALNKQFKNFLEVELPAHQATIKQLEIPTENDNPWKYSFEQIRYLVKLGEQYPQFSSYRKFHHSLNGEPLFERVALLSRQWDLSTIVQQRRLDKLEHIKLVIPDFNFNKPYRTIGNLFRRLIDIAVDPNNIKVLKWLIEQGVDTTCVSEENTVPDQPCEKDESRSFNSHRDLPNFPFNQASLYPTSELEKIFVQNEHALYDALAWYLYTNSFREFGVILEKSRADISKPIPAGRFHGCHLFQLIILYKRTDIFIKYRKLFLEQEKAKVTALMNACYPAREGFQYAGWSTLAVMIHQGLNEELDVLHRTGIAFSEFTLTHPRKYNIIQLLVDGASKNYRGLLDNQFDDSNTFKQCFEFLQQKDLINFSIERLTLWDEENNTELPILHFAIINFVYSVMSSIRDSFKENLRHQASTKDIAVVGKMVNLNPLQWAFIKKNKRAIKDLCALYERHGLENIIAEPMKDYEGISLFQLAVIRRYKFFLRRVIQWKGCPINEPFPKSHPDFPEWLPIHVALFDTFTWRSKCLDILLGCEGIRVDIPFPQGGNFSHHLVGMYSLSTVFFSERPEENASYQGGFFIVNYAPVLLSITKNSSIPETEKRSIFTQALAMAVLHYNMTQERFYRESIPVLIQEGADIYAEDVIESTRIIDKAYNQGKRVFDLFPEQVTKGYQPPIFHRKEAKEVTSISHSHVFVSQHEKVLVINFSQLEKTSQEITSEDVSQSTAEVLSGIQKQVENFNKDIIDPTLDRIYHVDALKELKKFISVKKEMVVDLNGAPRCKRLAEAILRRLSDEIQRVYLLFDPPQPLQSQPSYVDENRLRLEQRLLIGESRLAKAFATTLEKIRVKAGQYGQTQPDGVYICYAEPDDEDERDKHLWWVRSFLEELRNHLLLVGIKAKLKHKDQLQGESNHDYVKKAKTSDFVLLIGTETLVRAHRSGIGIICEELILINQKREDDKKNKKHHMFPVLISGNNRHSFPEEYESYVKEINWLEKGKTYYQKFRVLAELLYRVNPKTFENEWKTFLGVVHGEEEQGIIRPLVDEAVLAKMDGEETARLIEKQRETMASLKILGVLSADPANVSVFSPGDSKSGDGKQETKAEKKGEARGGHFTGAPESLSLAAQLKMFPPLSDGNKNIPEPQEAPSLAASAIQFSSTIDG